MSTDDATTDRSWYSSLNEEERTDLVARVAAQLEDQEEAKIHRRDLLKAAGVGMAGLSLGAGAVASEKINADDFMHRASAQSAAAGQVGTATEPVDVFASAVDTDEASIDSIPASYHVYTDGATIWGIPQQNPSDATMSEVTDTDIGLLLEEIIVNQLPPQGSRKEGRGAIHLKSGKYPGDLSSPTRNGVVLPAQTVIKGEVASHMDGSGAAPIPADEPPTQLPFTIDGFVTPNVDTENAMFPHVENVELLPANNADVAFHDDGAGSNFWDWLSLINVHITPEGTNTYTSPIQADITSQDRPVLISHCHWRGFSGLMQLGPTTTLTDGSWIASNGGYLELHGDAEITDSTLFAASASNSPSADFVKLNDISRLSDVKLRTNSDITTGAGVSVLDSAQVHHLSFGGSGSFARSVHVRGAGHRPKAINITDETASDWAVSVNGSSGVVEPIVSNVDAPNAVTKIQVTNAPVRPIINGTIELGAAPSGANYNSSHAGYTVLDTSVAPADLYKVAQDGTLLGPV